MTTFLRYDEARWGKETDMRWRRCGLALLASLWTVFAQAPCYAQTSNKVTAEALFESGRKLMAQGKYGEACPKFADSQRLDPSPATLLNLASCWEKAGRTASAWATYKEAASAASAVGRMDYRTTAEKHAGLLEPRLAHLTIEVGQPVEGLEIQRDGVTVDRAEWGVSIPVDTGSHFLSASAPGRESWTSEVQVAQDGVQVTAKVPPLVVLPESKAGAAIPAAGTTTAPAAATGGQGVSQQELAVDARGSSSNTQRTVAWIVGGAGVAGMGVAAAFSIVARNKYESSLSHCEANDKNLCDALGVSERNDARSAGDIATVAFGIGAAGILAGGVLWLTAPRARPEAPSGAVGPPTHGMSLSILPSPAGAAIRGVW